MAATRCSLTPTVLHHTTVLRGCALTTVPALEGDVLTSSVTLTQKVRAESLTTVDLDRIMVPVLVVRHRDDA